MSVVWLDCPIYHMSCWHCAGEDLFFLAACMDLNSITSGMTWKNIHVDNLRDPLTTVVFNFSSVKGNRLCLYQRLESFFSSIVALSCSKVTDSLAHM